MYRYYSPTHIKPTGWLRDQLQIQAKGLSGNLHKVWPDISDSAWIGGSHESWERVPYWLDGFIPLAYYLEDAELIQTAEHYMTEIINRQEPDGWICPCSKETRKDYDIWAGFLIGKVLTVYYSFTEKEAVKTCLYRAMACIYNELKCGNIKLFNWGFYRWYECFIPLQFLYEHYHEDWILEMAAYLKENGADYFDYTEHWKRPLNQWTLYTHVVNLAMMLKAEAVSANLLKTDLNGNAEKLWQILTKYNGTAVGTFTGDECLGGKDNNRGTELCSVVELMYSCQLIYAITGKRVWAERMEKVSYNALPATLSDDMWSHQYDQQVNQIACIDFGGKSYFGTNNSEAHLFGLEPHFGCCTSNFSQGWAKLVSNAFLKIKGGILCSYMMPATLSTTVNGVGVKISQITEYPFKFSCKYVIQTDAPVSFKLKIRLPRFAKNIMLNGKRIEKKDDLTLAQEWTGETVLSLDFEDVPHFCKRPHQLNTVEYGPLVFAMPISFHAVAKEYEKNGVVRKKPYCDYELRPTEEWQYGFSSTNLKIHHREVSKTPFSSKNPPVTIEADLQQINWGYADGYNSVSATFPKSKKPISAVMKKELYPYGCSKLRLTELPILKK